MAVRAILIAALLAAASVAATREHVTPIQKVLGMMDDMLAKAKAEKEAEKAQFAEYKKFCDSTSKEKQRAIAKATEEIEELKADIGEADATAMVAAKEVASLDADIATWSMEMKEMAYQREKAHAAFVKTHEEYDESVDSVERAVETIKAGPGSFTQTSLLEFTSTRLPEKAQRILMSFLQRPKHNLLLQDAADLQQAPVFEGHSGGIVEMVEQLGDKFQEEREELEKKEMNEKHEFDMMTADLTDQVESATKASSKKASIKASSEKDKASAEGELADTSATLAEDEKFLTDLTAECEQKSLDFDQRQATRQGEIEAIMKAIEIMSSDKVSGAGAKHLPGLVQTSSLAQLRSSSRSSAQNLVASFLSDRARQTKSRVLSLIAVKAGADPFKKVIKMIKDMITKLTEEAAEEAEHKGFCDTEMSQNKITRDTKTDEVASLTATIKELTADVAKLSEEITELSDAIAAIDAAMAKATAQRQAEKAKNTATIEDAKVAGEAVAQALTVLKEFYDKAATATALSQQEAGPTGAIVYDKRAMAILGGGGAAMVQTSVPGAPETFGDKPYTGMANGGVMGMLEVISSDFERLLSETTAGESEAQKEFEQFSSDSAADKEQKAADSKSKGNEKTKKESEMGTAKKDLDGSQSELSAAMEYFEKLKPSCVDAGETYEERVARRKEEIQSLQEALKILQGEDI